MHVYICVYAYIYKTLYPQIKQYFFAVVCSERMTRGAYGTLQLQVVPPKGYG